MGQRIDAMVHADRLNVRDPNDTRVRVDPADGVELLDGYIHDRLVELEDKTTLLAGYTSVCCDRSVPPVTHDG